MIRKLPFPDLSRASLLYTACGFRPYRKGGIRLQHQQIGDKHIFHNYGHGGAGISLAYGSAFVSAKSITIYHKAPIPSAQVAVLGSGIVGLCTVLELAKRGFKAVVYSERIPHYDDKPEQLICSQMATGKWSPGGYDYESDLLRHEMLSKLSFQYYKECIDTRKYRSLSFTKMYDAKSNIEELKQLIPEFLINDYQNVGVQFDNGKEDKFVEFTTIRINTRLFLEELLTEARLRGVQFKEKKFDTIDDVLALSEKNIMNCTGLGSRRIFNDQNMRAIKGHYLYFKNTNNIDYMMCAMNNGERVTLNGQGKELVIGISYKKERNGKIQCNDEQEYERIHSNAISYFENCKPRL